MIHFEINNLSVEQRLLPLSGQLDSGALLHLIGSNGAGKSTLLACIAGILPGVGNVLLNGEALLSCIPARQARLRAYLPQHQSVGSLMPIFHYLSLHVPPGAEQQQVDNVVNYLVDILLLADKLSCPLHQLSGGEWQRVRIAAVCLQVWPTLNTEAGLLLLDEPMMSLDIAQQAAVDHLIDLLLAAGLCVIASAHDLNHTLQRAQQVWMLQQGKIWRQGANEDVMTPENLRELFGIDFRLFYDGEYRWLTTVSNMRF